MMHDVEGSQGMTSKGGHVGTRAMLAVTAAVGIAALYQVVAITRDYVLPTVEQVWEIRGMPDWQRAAVFEAGEDFAGYLAFLRSQVPEDSRVILPPSLPEGPFSNIGYMQYFLFPRDIHNCGFGEVEACVLRVTGHHTYILGLPAFPPRDLAERSKRYVPYRDGFGVFVPR